MKPFSRTAVWAALAVVLSLWAFAAACGDDEEASVRSPSATATLSPAETVAAFPVTVVDSNGNELALEAAPKRIVALAPSFVEILFAIGAGDSLAAVDENSDFPPEAADKTKISGFQPSIEGIAGLEPDLVIIFYDPGDLQSTLETLGIPVLFLESPASVQGVFDHIQLLGRVSGHLDEAEDLIADMQDRIDAITAELADIQRGPSVFHELSPDLYTASDEDFVGDLYTILKARNIAAGAGPFPQLSQEAVITADPEVIILADEPAVTPEEVKARPGWENVSAIKNDRVYLVDTALVSRPGPRLVDGLEELARLLYPEKFP